MTEDAITTKPKQGGAVSVARQRVALLAFLLIVFAISERLLWLGNSYERTPWWAAAIFPLFALGATTQCFHTAAKLVGKKRTAWRCFGVACLGLFFAESTWAILDVFMHVPYTIRSVTDVLYFIVPIWFLVGFWFYRPPTTSTDDAFVQIGNLGIILSATVLMFLFTYVEFLSSQPQGSSIAIEVGYGVLVFSAPLFALIILSLGTRGIERRVMSLIFVALSFYAIADFNFVNQVMDGQYSLSSLSTGSILVVSALICWAAFEQRHSEDRRSVEGPSIEVEGLAKQWEGLLPPLAVAGVLVVALIQRHRLDTSLIPYAVGALLAFIGSLAMRNWWGSGLETRLRVDATQSQSALEGTNDELAAQNIELRRTQFELVESQGRLAVHQERLEYLVDERTRELEESRRALHTADRLASLGTLAAGLAHELNNPLGIIRLQAEDAILLSEKSNSDDALRGILEQTHRCAAIVKGVFRFSRDEPSQKRAEDLVDIVMDSIKLTDHYAAESGVEVIRRIGEGLGDDRDPGSSTVMGSATELEQVIVILLRNAVEASDFGSRVYVNVSRLEGLLRVEVVDEGKGMTEETREHAFDPFYTTKRDEGGTGLGLSIAHGIADQHGGSLRIHSQEGKGTTITLELARLEEA